MGGKLLSLENINVEVSRVKGSTERLEMEMKKEKLNRISCRAFLVELKTSLERLRYYFVKECKSYLQKIRPSDLLETLVLAWATPKIEQAIDSKLSSLISNVDSGIHQLDNPDYYKDENVRNTITNLSFSLDSFLTALSDSLSLPLTGISRIAELIAMKPVGLDENWATAICYLSTMEIVVNKKRHELQLENEKKDFAEKFGELLKASENRGIKMSELEKELPQAFWRIRHKVVHAGYCPKRDELELIIGWVKKIIKSFLLTT